MAVKEKGARTVCQLDTLSTRKNNFKRDERKDVGWRRENSLLQVKLETVPKNCFQEFSKIDQLCQSSQGSMHYLGIFLSSWVFIEKKHTHEKEIWTMLQKNALGQNDNLPFCDPTQKTL